MDVQIKIKIQKTQNGFKSLKNKNKICRKFFLILLKSLYRIWLKTRNKFETKHNNCLIFQNFGPCSIQASIKLVLQNAIYVQKKWLFKVVT